MQKSSFLFLLILLGVALIGAYYAFSSLPVPAMMVRYAALSAFFILCVSLIIGPLAVIDTKYASLIEPRRAVGLAAFVFVALHFLLAIALYFSWDVSPLLKFLPLQLVVPAILILLAMALTASDFAVKKLGIATWTTLQRFVYIAFVLILAHFLLQAGSHKEGLNVVELSLLLLAAITVLLQLYGFYLKRKRAAASKPAAA